MWLTGENQLEHHCERCFTQHTQRNVTCTNTHDILDVRIRFMIEQHLHDVCVALVRCQVQHSITILSHQSALEVIFKYINYDRNTTLSVWLRLVKQTTWSHCEWCFVTTNPDKRVQNLIHTMSWMLTSALWLSSIFATSAWPSRPADCNAVHCQCDCEHEKTTWIHSQLRMHKYIRHLGCPHPLYDRAASSRRLRGPRDRPSTAQSGHTVTPVSTGGKLTSTTTETQH